MRTNPTHLSRAARRLARVSNLSYQQALEQLRQPAGAATAPSPGGTDSGPAGGNGEANTTIVVLYRDASNYKQTQRFVLSGRLSAADEARLRRGLDEGLYFIPTQVGLPHLGQDAAEAGALGWRFPTGDDHVWHELEHIDSTDDASDTVMTAAELADAIADAEWDPDGQSEALGIPDEPGWLLP